MVVVVQQKFQTFNYNKPVNRRIMKEYFTDNITLDGNVMCIECSNGFTTIEISDNDGEFEPKSIKLSYSQLVRLARTISKMKKFILSSEIHDKA